MIDISPYMQRLEWLKEWMGAQVLLRLIPYMDFIQERDGWACYEFLNCNLIVDKDHPNFVPSFDEYCNYKQSLSKTTI